MSRYQHTKGQIKDNAIEALLGQWQESKSLFYHWPSAFRHLLRAVILLFQQIANLCQ